MKLILVFTDWIFEICVFCCKNRQNFPQECLTALNWTHWPSIFSGEWSRQLPKCDSYLWTELLYTQMRFIRIVRAAYHYFKYLVADATIFYFSLVSYITILPCTFFSSSSGSSKTFFWAVKTVTTVLALWEKLEKFSIHEKNYNNFWYIVFSPIKSTALIVQDFLCKYYEYNLMCLL
jgi:hypothetical protein